MTGKSLTFSLTILALILGSLREASGQSGLLTISAARKVDLIIIDPLGRRTGFDPMTNQDFGEIPDANYGYDGTSDLDDPNGDNQTWSVFTTSEDSPPINGNYSIRTIGVSAGNFAVSCFGFRDTVNWGGVNIQGTTAPGRVLYYSLAYNQNPNVPVTLAQVPSSRQVSGGIFNPTGSTLSVHAKPNVSFGSGNTLQTGVATIRWLTAYGITLANVTTTYGFAKWDSVIVSGNYSYQKFRTTSPTSLNWSANTEYELFTVQANGGSGLGTFEMTNAIPGGEWYVDVNYSDKSDTAFFNRSVSSALPIQLVSFTDTLLSGNHVRFNWETLTETNNYGFYVQESQNSPTSFQTVPNGFIPGHGTTLVPQFYSFTDNTTGPGLWYYRLEQQDLDNSVHYYDTLQVVLMSACQIKAGIFNPVTTSTLSVKVKPNVSFASSDTLQSGVITMRWQSRYPVTLGTVSSPIYGYVKSGSVVTQGSYNYQKFTTTVHSSVPWVANYEYELFTVPVNGSAGVEDFQLTNGLTGGTVSVKVGNIERADTNFYQSVATCTGLAWQNKSDNGGATFHNGSRHLAKTSTKLHEVYSSGGEILYRRKDLSGSWEVAQRISLDSQPSQNEPCIIVAHDGSVHVVWQQWLASTLYALWYNRSTDGGSTWGNPTSLAQNISIIQDQWNIYPVIAEYASTQLFVVWCTGSGSTTSLGYNSSSDLGQHWAGNQALSSSGSVTWYPSLVAGSGFLMLTYDGRYNGVFSRIYNGTWLPEISVSNGDGMLSDRCSSVSVDDQSRPIAAWCAQSYSHNEYTIVFRSGNTNGSWGSGFVQFAVDSTGIHDLYPSLTYVNRGGVPGTDIIYAASNNKIRVNKSISGSWQSPVTLSTSGQWPNTSIANQTTSPGYPIRVWTDQVGNPYLVALQSDGGYSFQKVQAPGGLTTDLHRRIVVESQSTRSTIWFDLAPLKIVTTANDTLVVPFKTLDMTNPFTATMANAWDYLGTDQLTLPANARSLIVEADIRSQARQDTLGKPGTNVFTTSSFRLDGVRSTQTVPLLANQPGVSARKVVDVSHQAGQSITFRMVGTIPATSTEPVTIGVGDVFISRNP